MKYTLEHKRWGYYQRKLREDHIELLYDIYKKYGIKPWRSDILELCGDRNKKQYFIERMSWVFNFIEVHFINNNEKKNLLPNQKQMRHYKITPKGLKILIQLNFNIKDEHVMIAARETLVEK